MYSEYLNVFDNNNKNENNNISEEVFLNDYFNNYIQKFVVIIAGSTSDEKHCLKIQSKLREKNIYSKIYYCSAHKNTRGVLDILERYENRSGLCYVTVAGMSNAY